ncbi:MAG: hypothetical protein JW846_01515 [Dehalococcoidia bacterium]|nr:hypothetical protein [Dehalococcoidia bacterium]
MGWLLDSVVRAFEAVADVVGAGAAFWLSLGALAGTVVGLGGMWRQRQRVDQAIARAIAYGSSTLYSKRFAKAALACAVLLVLVAILSASHLIGPSTADSYAATNYDCSWHELPDSLQRGLAARFPEITDNLAARATFERWFVLPLVAFLVLTAAIVCGGVVLRHINRTGKSTNSGGGE